MNGVATPLRSVFRALVRALWMGPAGDGHRANHVVFVTQMFPPEKGGNASRIHDTATALQEGAWEVTVLAPPPTIPPGEFDRSWQRIRTEAVDGVTVHRLWTPQPLVADPSMVRRIPYYLVFAGHAAAWLLRHHRRYDVVLTSSPPIFTGAPGIVAAACRKRLVVDVRDLWIDAAVSLGYLDRDSILERASRAFQRLVLHAADLVTVTTETTGRRVREGYGDGLGETTVVVPNGVDTDRFSPVDPAADGRGEAPTAEAMSAESAERPTIIYTGNLGTAQDLAACIGAMAHLEDDRAVLQLVGGGDDESRLRSLATALDVEDRVEFVGPIPREAVPVYLARATVGVAPLKDTQSLSYAMPTKVYEYLACALPTLVTGRGEIARFADGAGCVHADNDPERIADRLDDLLSDEDRRRRIGETGRERVRDRYDRTAIADHLEGELSTLLERRG
jgi:glycosyltransferase involved in cell wall biosynthesis